MARKRFTKEERTFLVPGARVEWNNQGHWHAATILTAELRVSDGGWQTMLATNHATTATLHNGQTISVSPGKVRPATAARTVLDGFREASARYVAGTD